MVDRKKHTQLVSVPYMTVEFQTQREFDRLEVPDFYQAVLNDFANTRRDVWLTGVRMPLGI